jgi:alpha-beta hydrolase superfamily lysophospholipase
VEDIQAFVDHIGAKHGVATENIAVVGQSLSAVLLAAWAHDYAPRVRRWCRRPAFRVKLYVPWARPLLRLLHRVRGNFFVTSYVKARFLTHDALRIASFESDALITRSISVRVLLGLCDLAKRIVADAEAITVATQVLISVATGGRCLAPARLLRTPRCADERTHVFEGFYHDTLGEKDRQPRSIKSDRSCSKYTTRPPSGRRFVTPTARLHTSRGGRARGPLAKLSWRGLCWVPLAGFSKWAASYHPESA